MDKLLTAVLDAHGGLQDWAEDHKQATRTTVAKER
jgi:hypothetical protein